MKISRGLKLLVLELAGLLLAATSSSGLSGFGTPSVPQPQLEGEWIQGLRFSADESWQALRHQERDYYGLGAFERLSPNMRERLLMRERAWDPHWGATGAAQQVDLSKISPVVQIAAFQDKMAFGPGSGTLIHPSGLILTNSHVVRKGPGGCGATVQGDLGNLFVVLVTEKGKEDQPPVPKFTAVLVAEDPQLDVALLEIKQQVDGLKDLKELKEAVAQGRLSTSPLPAGLTLPHWNLWDSRVLKEESRVLAWGYPEDKPGVELPRLELSRGPIFTLRPPEGPQHLFIDKLFTIPGISGGPVVDPKTDLIVGVICGRGIPTKPTKPAEELTKAILVNEIQDLLKKAPQRINYYPVADFTWSPLNPKVGDVVTFDASLSFDFDGSIKKYEWDFNSDGKPDATGKQASFKVPSLEDLRVMLTVKDNEGASNSQIKRVILQREQTCKVRLGEREFTSIREAIEKAKAGDTITIFEGQCQEDVVIAGKQGLTLKGAGRDKTTLFGTGTAPVITIQDSQGIMVEGLTIRDGLVGLLVQNSSNVIIWQNTVMQNLGRGISLMNASSVKIEQNVIEANGEEGLQVRGAPKGEPVEARGNEIRKNEEGGVLIRETVGTQYTLRVGLVDNKIEDNRLVGIAITHFAAAEISGGQITETKGSKGRFGIGLEIDSSKFETVSVTAITILNNVIGVKITGNSKKIRISTSMISQNGINDLTEEGSGLIVEGSAQVEMSNSRVSDNLYGIQVLSLATLEISQSIISGNQRDGLLVTDSTQLSLSDSKVSDNGVGLPLRGVGLWVGGSVQVNLTNSIVSGNELNGLEVFGQATLHLHNSIVSDNKGLVGLSVFGPAMVSLTSTQVFGNGTGLSVEDRAAVTLISSRVSGNRSTGLEVSYETIVKMQDTWISDNAGCGILRRYESGRLTGQDNWVLNNIEDFCNFTPPEAFLRQGTPPLRDEAEVCSQGCSFANVGPAVWAVRPGGVVRIHAGTYQGGGVVLVKDLTLEGAGKEHTVLTGSKVGIVIAGSARARVQGLKLSGNLEGLWVIDSAQASLIDLQISSNREDGLFLTNSAHVAITNSQISNNSSALAVSSWGPAIVSLSNSQISHNWIGFWVRGSAQVSLLHSRVFDNGRGFSVWDSAMVNLISSQVSNNGTGLEVGYKASVNLTDSIVSNNTFEGIIVRDSAEAKLTRSHITGNVGIGLAVRDKAIVSITNSTISANKKYSIFIGNESVVSLDSSYVFNNKLYGLLVRGSAQVTLKSSTVFGNGQDGLFVGDSATVVVRDSIIEGNGIDPDCASIVEWPWICNGIWAHDRSKVAIIDSKIINNADWGLAAWLKRCGYEDDLFVGNVIFEGQNMIEGNNKSGNHKGNPGNHPWNRPNVPDGQVCLP